MNLRLLIKLTAALYVLLVSPALAISCGGSSLWTKMPAATKAQLRANAARQPFPSGRFFKIEKGGQVSYLLGTIHVPPIKQLALPSFVLDQVPNSRVVYLEKTNREFDAFSSMLRANPGYYRSSGLNGFAKHFTAAEQSVLRKNLSDVGWGRGALDTLQPWFIFDEISGIGCGQDSEGFKRSLDERVLRKASRHKRPTAGLETPELVDRYYRELSKNQLIVMLKSLPTMNPRFPHGGLGKAVISLLAAEEVVLAMQFQEFIEAQHLDRRGVQMRKDFFDKKILHARNKAWMPALTRAFNNGGAFVAVGAAHLNGTYGLLPMLHKRGYKITRIPLK